MKNESSNYDYNLLQQRKKTLIPNERLKMKVNNAHDIEAIEKKNIFLE